MDLKSVSLFKVLFCLLVISFETSAAPKRQIPLFIKKCSAKAPMTELSQCILDNVNFLKPRLSAGIPEMRIPGVDPFTFPEVSSANGQIEMTFINLSIIGMSNFEVKGFEYSLDPLQMTTRVNFPALFISGQYRMKGRLLFLDLDSSGPFQFNSTDVFGESTVKGKIEKVKRKSFGKLDDNQIAVKLNGKSVFDLQDLFKNNPELTKNTNQVINDNVGEITKDFLPLTEQIAGNFIFKVVQQVYKTFPMEELFTDY